MPFYDYWGMGGFYGGFGLVFMVLGVVVMVSIIIAILHFLFGVGPSVQTREERSRALHILEERFAHGEIDEEEFNKRRRILERGK